MNQRAMRLDELRSPRGLQLTKSVRPAVLISLRLCLRANGELSTLALRDSAELRTESEGEGLRRYVVVYPKDYKSAPKPARRTIS